MKLLFLFGNAAVGKMTVGQELMKLTGLRLFHNHMTIEPVMEIFPGRTTASPYSGCGMWSLKSSPSSNCLWDDFHLYVGLRPTSRLELCGAHKGHLPALWNRVLLCGAGGPPGGAATAQRHGKPPVPQGIQNGTRSSPTSDCFKTTPSSAWKAFLGKSPLPTTCAWTTPTSRPSRRRKKSGQAWGL